LVILELAIVHDATNRWIGVRGYLNEVKPLVVGITLSVRYCKYPKLVAF
jgi:hypothetical protein